MTIFIHQSNNERRQKCFNPLWELISIALQPFPCLLISSLLYWSLYFLLPFSVQCSIHNRTSPSQKFVDCGTNSSYALPEALYLLEYGIGPVSIGQCHAIDDANVCS